MLDPRYVLQQDLQEYLVDKNTGLPLAGGKIFYYVDNNRTEPKTVYQLTGAPPNYSYAPLTNPIILGINGCPSSAGNDIAVYLFPYDAQGNVELYYIVVQDSMGNQEFTRQAWPNTFSGSSPANISATTPVNLLSNPQFAVVNFTAAPYVITISAMGTYNYDIAPGWTLRLITTGAASVSLTQTPIAGDAGFPTNPAYALTITSSGAIPPNGGIMLVQTLADNPNIWAPASGDLMGYVATTVTLGAQMASVQVVFQPKPSGSSTVLLSQSNNTGLPQTYANTVQLNPANNTSSPSAGYCEFQIILQPSGTTEITSIQAVGMATQIQNMPFLQEPVNRQIDHLFNYYNPLLQYKPIPSYLVGWDFPVNPKQVAPSTLTAQNTGNNTGYYVWDQTIVYQSLTSGFSYAPATDGSLQITTQQADVQLAVIQYLDGKQINDLFENPTSVYMSLLSDTAVNGTVSLWACTDATLPKVTSGGSYKSIIATIDANGHPMTTNGAWTEIMTQTGTPNTFSLSATSLPSVAYQQIPLSGWQPNAALVGTGNFFAIVTGFAALPLSANLVLNKIGLNLGSIATIPAPKTHGQSLQESQYFYEKSYSSSTAPGSVTNIGRQAAPMGVQNNGSANFFSNGDFSIRYNSIKRTNTPTVNLYSPAISTINMVYAQLQTFGSSPATSTADVATTSWTLFNGNKTAYYAANANLTGSLTTGNTSSGGSAFISYHYVSDARLGIVD